MEETYLEQFKKDVVDDEGRILSDGTLNPRHLLAKAYDLCEVYALNVGLQEEILKVYDVEGEIEGESLFTKQYYDEANIPQEKEQEAHEIWNEDVYNFFQSISPDGYYFGSSEGDGACIGWFKSEESFE